MLSDGINEKSVSAEKLFKILSIVNSIETYTYRVYSHFIDLFVQNKIRLISCNIHNLCNKCINSDEFVKYLNCGNAYYRSTYDGRTLSCFNIVKENGKKYIHLALTCYNSGTLYGNSNSVRWNAEFRLNKIDLLYIKGYILSTFEDYLSDAYNYMIEKKKIDWMMGKFNSIINSKSDGKSTKKVKDKSKIG